MDEKVIEFIREQLIKAEHKVETWKCNCTEENYWWGYKDALLTVLKQIKEEK